MEDRRLRELLEQIRQQEVSVDEALNSLRRLPYENLGFARIDHHRSLRTGVPEVIFCQRKTVEQVQAIVRGLAETHTNVMATWAGPELFEAIKQVTPHCEYHALARVVVINPKPVDGIGKVIVVSAGTSDISVAEEAAVTAEILGSTVQRIYDVGVAGIHRLLDVADDLFTANVIVVVAGMEGALASVVGGLAPCPVIGVPTSVGYGASFGGVAALLSMLNSCASGVSVVNIDNGFGAGYQAALINRIAAREGSAASGAQDA
ncbi:MAG: nickel pincer cofactor biosynthesis protein LarB [Syntrophobacteraceae bacterium]